MDIPYLFEAIFILSVLVFLVSLYIILPSFLGKGKKKERYYAQKRLVISNEIDRNSNEIGY